MYCMLGDVGGQGQTGTGSSLQHVIVGSSLFSNSECSCGSHPRARAVDRCRVVGMTRMV